MRWSDFLLSASLVFAFLGTMFVLVLFAACMADLAGFFDLSEFFHTIGIY